MSENSAPVSRINTHDGTYERGGIHLVDTTIEQSSELPAITESTSHEPLARKPTRASVKDQLARRKYAKWRQDKYNSASEDVEAGASEEETGRGRAVTHHQHPDSQAVDFAPGENHPNPLEGDGQTNRKQRKHKKQDFEIDILYENQRGSFFCGIPLYSHSSLLNFDPSAWVTKDFRDSAVNITNAQVPDPSWVWTWKTWYVDMSGDVDEEGWQYSFMFGNRFAWHGTHPWFHSFVRRRRWLRKRVKRSDLSRGKEKPSSMGAAHHLNADYFTIHSKQRGTSPGSARESLTAAKPASYISYQSAIEVDEPPDEIKDVASLLKALRRASIDRERIDAVKQFVKDGGEELYYLEDCIPEIMSFLVFQNSKRQLLEFLKQSANDAQQHREEHEAENKPEGKAESRRIDNLLKAVHAANTEIKGLEFWSDRKHVLQTTDETDKSNDQSLKNTFDTPAAKPKPDSNPARDIVGIPAAAEVKMRPRSQIAFFNQTEGKGKEREQKVDNPPEPESPPQQDSKIERNGEPRLGRDAVLIPDEDAE